MTDRDRVVKNGMNRTHDAHSMASARMDEEPTGNAKSKGDAMPKSTNREKNMVESATRDDNVMESVMRDGNAVECAKTSSQESVTTRKRKRRPSSTGSMDDI